MAQVQTGRELILRTCGPNGESQRGFRWPLVPGAVVEAPDWRPTDTCGNGLHGFLRGEGNVLLADWSTDAKWLVAEITEWIGLGGKVKFPRATVLYAGDRAGATAFLHQRDARGRIIGLTLTGGDNSVLTGGDRSTLTGGDRSTLTGGYDSVLTGGDRSTLTGGDNSVLTGGDRSTLTGGYDSVLTGGDRSTLTGGYYSNLTGGDGSTLTGGDDSVLVWRVWRSRWRLIVAYVGEDGIEPGVPYRLDSNDKPVRAEA